MIFACSDVVCRAEYRTLLHSLVPKEAIQRIKDERNWASMVATGAEEVKTMKLGKTSTKLC